jgi:hypothetical protein
MSGRGARGLSLYRRRPPGLLLLSASGASEEVANPLPPPRDSLLLHAAPNPLFVRTIQRINATVRSTRATGGRMRRTLR